MKKVKVEKDFYTSKKLASVDFSKTFRRRAEEDDDDAMPKKLYRNSNHIYFFDKIDEISQMWLQTEMQAAYRELIASNAESMVAGGGLPESIFIHINSPGGLCSSSFALYDFIKEFPIPVVGIVEGLAASGASIILCACAVRQATKHSHVLIHELRGGAFGKYSELKDSAINDETLMKAIKEIYISETDIPVQEIDTILSRDLYWDVNKCKEYGFIDFAVGEEPDDAVLNAKIQKRICMDNCECEEHSKAKSTKKEKKPVDKKATAKKATAEKAPEKKPAAKKSTKEDK